MNKKILPISLAIVVFAAVGLYVTFNDMKKTDLSQKPIPTVSPTIIPTLTPTNVVQKEVENGSISGKLCYPSSFLPKGFVQAKNIETNEITQVEYKGSDEEKTSNYSIKLKPGKYFLRYEAHASGTKPEIFTYGYSTDVCTTGLETTCANTNKRKNIEYEVQPNIEIKDVSICDFYYLPETEPKF